MKEPKIFTCIWTNTKGEFKYFYTNDEHTALNKKIKHAGEVYIDTRYAAKMRLYKYILNKHRI
jgi:hypothetical protein